MQKYALLFFIGLIIMSVSLAEEVGKKEMTLRSKHSLSSELDEVNEFGDENEKSSGPPLDVDNRLKDIRNKGKPPKHQPKATKTNTGRLVNRFHWMLKMDNFNVTSTRNGEDPASEMNVTSVKKDLVTIRGIKANRYLCMNSDNGELYATADVGKNCIFKEYVEENFHTSYRLNNKNSPWFLGINNDGTFIEKAVKKYHFPTLFQLIS